MEVISDMEKIRDLIIIGAGPAGLTAAIYAKRAGFDTLVIDETGMGGGQIVNTYEVDNYPGLIHINGFDMGMKFKEHATEMGTEFADVTYSPVAWIGKKQSEAGQEYKVFCSATPKLFGGKSTYAILDITENLIGGATITQLSESSMEVFGTDEGAGYAQAGPDISKTEGQYFEEASKTLVGANYTALALLSKKKERGYAFCFIAEQTEIAENAVPSIGLEYVKVDEDGKVTLEKYVDFGSL